MARPSEKHLPPREKLKKALARYARVYYFVQRRLQGGGTKHSAYRAAEKELGIPYSTVKHQFDRMRKSIDAAVAAGVAGVELFDAEPEHPLAEVERVFDHGVADREPLELDPEYEPYMEAAFTPDERQALRRVPEKLRAQLAAERLELIRLRKGQRK